MGWGLFFSVFKNAKPDERGTRWDHGSVLELPDERFHAARGEQI